MCPLTRLSKKDPVCVYTRGRSGPQRPVLIPSESQGQEQIKQQKKACVWENQEDEDTDTREPTVACLLRVGPRFHLTSCS